MGDVVPDYEAALDKHHTIPSGRERCTRRAERQSTRLEVSLALPCSLMRKAEQLAFQFCILVPPILRINITRYTLSRRLHVDLAAKMPVNQVLDQRYVDRELLLHKLLELFGHSNFSMEVRLLSP